jgi:hypothetical protein
MGLVTDRPEWKPLLAELEAKGVPRTVADVLSIGLIVRRCNPILRREVVERQESVAILDRAIDGLPAALPASRQ